MKKIVIIGAGVAGINAATKLVDNGYDGSLITIIDKGNDPINRLPEEVMTGMLGAGGWSDGKLVVSTVQGGQLSKYCGEEKAMSLMEEVVANFTRFHPKPDEISCSDPKTEPDFIKPYFDLRMSLVWHIGSNYLHEIAKNWYQYLLDKGVTFKWNEGQPSYYTQEQICAYVGFSPSTYQKAKKYLIDLKWIKTSKARFDSPVFVTPCVGIDDARYEKHSWAKGHQSNKKSLEEQIDSLPPEHRNPFYGQSDELN